MSSIRLFVCAVAFVFAAKASAATRPNVVIVITDDQGYGDMSCHGNPQLRTPNIDALHSDSVRLTNFHVDPTCAPTRSALMTGKYSRRVGVWHTVMGRSFLPPEETTLAERFVGAGYRTALFGKWHLGDNYPCRPQDQGFEQVLTHGGGGVTQIPDFWGNDYFDDVYVENGHPRQFDGYCTDVWFREATNWLEENRESPFLLYVATNAPHAPYLVEEKYSAPYKAAGIESPRAEFYGMIANFDENLGRLRQKLDDLKLAENTIFLYMTDNGTAAGSNQGGFNAGMRARKGSEYDGGHRVPCFVHWPAGKLAGGRDVSGLTAHIDLMPTLCALCEIPIDADADLDGVDLSAALNGGAAPTGRTLCLDTQRIEHPQKGKNYAVLADRWRLINGTELYDIDADPGQKADIAAQHTDTVADLRQAYDRWWGRVSVRDADYVRITLGAEVVEAVNLTAHDWHPLPDDPQPRIFSQQEALLKDPVANGFWAVDVERAGRYEFQLRRRPAVDPTPTQAVRTRVTVGEAKAEATTDPALPTADLLLDLPAGPAMLTTTLVAADGTERGAYFVEVRRVE